MAEKFEKNKVVDQAKTLETIIETLESNAIIVRVQGWRRRVHFDKTFNHESLGEGKIIKLMYFGDLESTELVKFEKLK